MVISAPSAAKTRPPLARQLFRSYWHGPISGCLRHSAATLGANSIAVCCCLLFVSITQTYCVFGGTTIFGAAGVGCGYVGGAIATGGIAGVSRGRRATAAPTLSLCDVVASGGFSGADAQATNTAPTETIANRSCICSRYVKVGSETTFILFVRESRVRD